MREFENITAGTSVDPSDIYQDLGAEEQRRDPRSQPIHCFGGTAASVAAAGAGSVTCTPSGMIIRPDSPELSDVQAALVTITGITVGGLPIMHGGAMPGDSFRSTATYKLRPALAVSSTNPLVVSFTNNHSAAVVLVLGVKGPVMRA